jgi:hypothetical protein
MPPDGDAEVSVERLKDDVDRLSGCRTGIGFLGDPGELGHQERPPDETEVLDHRRQDDQIRISDRPPARKRASTSCVGRRSTSG